MKQKILTSILMALLLFSGMPAVFAESEAIQVPDGCVALTVLHTNDTHGQYKNTPTTVGFEKLKTIANEKNADLIVDAGDVFHGIPFATIEKGKSTAELLNAVGYDAVGPGNHDFNYGAKTLKDFSFVDPIIETPEDSKNNEEEMANPTGFKVLNANVVNTSDNSPYFEPYKIKEIKRGEGPDAVTVKVGIVGLISQEFYNHTAPDNVKDVRFNDAIESAKKTVALLKEQEKCDVVVALTHIGMTEQEGVLSSKDIALQVPEIDLIIDGHTHAKYDTMVGDTLITQTGYNFGSVGLVNLFYNPTTKKVESTVGSMITASEAANYDSDWAVSEAISKIEERQSKVFNEVVGFTNVLLEGSLIKSYMDETNLGRVITASYLDATGADIAFENGGGIRASIPAGTINRGQTIAVSPFGNYLVTKEVSGADIRSILEKSLEMGSNNYKAYLEGKKEWPSNGGGSYLQIGGIKVVYDANKSYGDRVISADIGGAPLDQDKIYKIVTNQYIASSNKFQELAKKPEINTYGATEEVLTKYIQKYSGKPEWTALMETRNLNTTTPAPTPSPKPENTVDPSPKPEIIDPENPDSSDNAKVPQIKETTQTKEIKKVSDKVPTGIFVNEAGSAIFAVTALAIMVLMMGVLKYESDYRQEKNKDKR